MHKRFPKYLSPPTFADEDKTWTARLLYIFSEIGLASAVVLAFVFIFLTGDFGLRLMACLLSIPVLIFVMVMVRKGQVRFAAYMLVVLSWIVSNYTVLLTGGVHTVGFSLNLLVILEAGLLISLYAGLIVAGLSSLAGLIMAISHTQSWFNYTSGGMNVFAVWAVQSLLLGLMAVLLYINISKIQQSLARHKRSEARYRGLLENIPAILYVTNVGQEPVNPTVYESSQLIKILGYSREDFYQDPNFWINIIHPDDRERVWAESERADVSGEPFISDYRIIARDQKTYWFHDESSLVKDDEGQPLYRVGVCTDITERVRSDERIQNQLERLNALHNIDNAINATNNLSVTLRILIDELIAQLKVDAAAILLFNHHTLSLDYAVGHGFQSDALQATKLKYDEGFAGRVMAERKTIHITNLPTTDSLLAQALSQAGENFITYIGSPLIAKDQVVGVLEIFHHPSLSPNPEWFDFLDLLTGQAAIAIENAQLFDSLQQSNTELALAYDATIEGMSRALDLRDKETQGHTQRVTSLTVKLAQQMGVPDSDIIHIRRGTLLHDIGKLGVPDNILLKPRALSPKEWDIMRRHPIYAHEMLFPINYLRPALDIPYCHHEKWDGTGYPRGLSREQIPLAARIFAVVDVYDALTSNRPYRQAWSQAEALEYIRSMSGKHFDPQVVDCLLSIMSEKIRESEN